MKRQLTILALGGIILFSGINFAKAESINSLAGNSGVNAQAILKGDNLKSVLQRSGVQGLVGMMNQRLDMILSHPKVTAELRTKIANLKVRLQADQPFEKKENKDSIKTLWQDILKDTMQLRKDTRHEKATTIFNEIDSHIATIITRSEALKARAADNADALRLINNANTLIASAKANLATARGRLATEDLEGLRKYVKENVFQILTMARNDLQSAFNLLKTNQ